MSYEKYYPNGWQSGESGGTPITPEALEHMEEGIANNAPGGYGLGEASYGNDATSYTTQEELDGLIANGFWAYRNMDVPLIAADPNTRYVKGLTIAYSKIYETQIAFCVYTGTCIVRERSNGEWGEWEYVNPPMNLGVEYRTTERFKGEAVYTQVFNAGNIVHNAYVAYPVNTEQKYIIRGHATLSDGTHLPFGLEDNTSDYFASAEFCAWEMWMRCGSAQTSKTVIAQIWYTKEELV